MCARPVAVLCALLFAAAVGDAKAFSTQVSSHAFTTGTVDVELVGCEGGSVLGGGFDPEDPALLDFQPLDSSPYAVLLGGGTGWRVEMRDETGAAGARLVRGAAICGDVPDRSVVTATDGVFIQLPLPAEPTAACPTGRKALGGGFRFLDIEDPYDTSGPPLPPQERTLIALSPIFDIQIFDDRPLGELSEGTYGAPYAFKASALSSSHFTSSAFPFPSKTVGGVVTAFVVCADLADEDIVTIVSQGTALPNSLASHTARCPTRWVAVGGGVESAGTGSLEITSSAPLFAGFPLAKRLWNVDDGARDAPIGWRATIWNDDPNFDRSFNVAAICVPEPAASLASSAACLLLFLLANRREASGRST